MSTKKVSEMSAEERRAALEAVQKRIDAAYNEEGENFHLSDFLDNLEPGEAEVMNWADEGMPEVWPMASSASAKSE